MESGGKTGNAKVVFLDSGVGGLPYLELARQLLPDATLHYLADDAGFPYGTKAPAQLIDILLDRVRRLRARLLPDALVIACNTASQVGLAEVRQAHPDLHVIGTVPAIKPAAASTRTGKVAILATERTVVDPYLDDLIARYAPEIEVFKVPAQSLVTFVERRYLASTPGERREAVLPLVGPLVEAGVDRIVLACTHFLHVETDIAKCAASLGGLEVEIVDSRTGVVNRLAEILANVRFSRSSPKDGSGIFLLSGEKPHDPGYTLWAERFGLTGPERL